MADDMGEKTEAPTPRRKSQARSRGQVPKSQDLAASLGLLTATIVLVMMGGGMLGELGDEMRRVLAFEDDGALPYDEDDLRGLASRTFGRAAAVAWPPMAIVLGVAWLVQFAQVGPLFTLKPIKPKLSKLNPISGIKKLFSTRNLVKSGVNSLKLAVMVAGCWIALSTRMGTLAAVPKLEAVNGVLTIGRIVLELAIILVIILILIGAIDYIYQRWQHHKDLKMTKFEVKDERRSMEGDPQIKKKQFGLYQQIVMQQTRSGTQQADVIVTNPTHYAVAIKYDPDEMRAPKIVAKGADWLALQMRQLARTAGIPIVERPPLARALYAGVEVGELISPEHYEAVADVLAYVYRMDTEARRRHNDTVSAEAEQQAAMAA